MVATRPYGELVMWNSSWSFAPPASSVPAQVPSTSDGLTSARFGARASTSGTDARCDHVPTIAAPSAATLPSKEALRASTRSVSLGPASAIDVTGM